MDSRKSESRRLALERTSSLIHSGVWKQHGREMKQQLSHRIRSLVVNYEEDHREALKSERRHERGAFEDQGIVVLSPICDHS